MLPNSLRYAPRAPISIGLIIAGACAQSATTLPSQSGGNAAAPVPAVAKAPPGLPEFLLPVPAGPVEMGMTADALLHSAAQVVNPIKPEPARVAETAKEPYLTAMRRTASALGRRKIDVPEFLLARWPVKCIEYEAYLQARRAQGAKLRPPYHWWRYGREDHYLSVLTQIGQQFPKDKMGPLLYWERHGVDLPYALKDAQGAVINDMPVTYVDYREANDFAAWYGMRLPTEAEFTRAARGNGTNVWPWGKTPETDVYTEESLKQLRLFNTPDRALKAVGSAPGATGPFGHLDMFGQVWQLVSGMGYKPINGADPFAAEWKVLQKDKVGALLQSPPLWRDDRVLGKGGCYLSGGEPIQLLVDARANVQTIEVLEGMGFRLAKSMKPGYDTLYSLLRGVYNRAPFAMEQDIDLTQQIGAERYELGPTGFPSAYYAVSFAPVDWVTKDPRLDLPKLLEKSQTSPLLVGTFVTTVALLEPKVAAGHYSVLYRKEGVPKELTEAIKAAVKDLANGKKKPDDTSSDAPLGSDPMGGSEPKDKEKDKDKGKSKEKEGKDKPEKQDPKKAWREIVTKFGLTDEDLSGKDAANGLDFIRIDGVKVPTNTDCFLLHDNDGKVAAAIPVPTAGRPTAGNAFAPEFAFEANAAGKAIAKFHVGAQLLHKTPKKVVDMHFTVTLDQPMPTADTPWRLPGQ